MRHVKNLVGRGSIDRFPFSKHRLYLFDATPKPGQVRTSRGTLLILANATQQFFRLALQIDTMRIGKPHRFPRDGLHQRTTAQTDHEIVLPAQRPGLLRFGPPKHRFALVGPYLGNRPTAKTGADSLIHVDERPPQAIGKP